MKDKSAEHVGLVVNVLAFYSDNPSSNPAEVYMLLEKNENKQKEVGLGPFNKVAEVL